MTAPVIRLRTGAVCPAWRCRGAGLDRHYRCPTCGTGWTPIPTGFRRHVQAAINHARTVDQGPEPASVSTFDPENARAREDLEATR